MEKKLLLHLDDKSRRVLLDVIVAKWFTGEGTWLLRILTHILCTREPILQTIPVIYSSDLTVSDISLDISTLGRLYTILV